jgi:hypothetical protein
MPAGGMIAARSPRETSARPVARAAAQNVQHILVEKKGSRFAFLPTACLKLTSRIFDGMKANAIAGK